MTDGTLKCEDVYTSSGLTETHCKLTVWEKEYQSHRTSQLCLQYWTERHIQKCIQPCQGRTSPVCQSHITLSGRNGTDEERRVWAKLSKTHVIRHSCSDWSGSATVLIVEPVLMCSLKSIGGLSHGRKWSGAQQFSWLLSKPTCAEYSQPSETQKITSVSFPSSD